jgi:hypothetical protein
MLDGYIDCAGFVVFWCVQDLSVQHRQANVAHARSVLLGQSGSAAAAAAAAAAMAAAASVRLEHL